MERYSSGRGGFVRLPVYVRHPRTAVLARWGRVPGLRTAKTTFAAVLAYVAADLLQHQRRADPRAADRAAGGAADRVRDGCPGHPAHPQRAGRRAGRARHRHGRRADLVEPRRGGGASRWWSGSSCAWARTPSRCRSARCWCSPSAGGAEGAATGRVYETLIGAAVGVVVNFAIAPPVHVRPAGDRHRAAGRPARRIPARAGRGAAYGLVAGGRGPLAQRGAGARRRRSPRRTGPSPGPSRAPCSTRAAARCARPSRGCAPR